MIKLSRGELYPFEIATQDTAVADFLRPGVNRLLIVLSNMTTQEERSFRYGTITGNFLYKNGAMLWLFQFYSQSGELLLTFDAPFDARLIPDSGATTVQYR